MRNRPVILHRPAKAQSIESILDILLQILSVIEVIYNLFTGLFGGAR